METILLFTLNLPPQSMPQTLAKFGPDQRKHAKRDGGRRCEFTCYQKKKVELAHHPDGFSLCLLKIHRKFTTISVIYQLSFPKTTSLNSLYHRSFVH